jgi:hypothetical protein
MIVECLSYLRQLHVSYKSDVGALKSFGDLISRY